MKENTYKTHQKILGAIMISYALMLLITALSLIAAVDIVKMLVFDDFVIHIVTAFSKIFGIGLLVISIPSIIAGIGMLKEKEWSKTFTLILGIFFLIIIPIGTIIGIYAIWFNAQHVIKDKLPVMATDLIKNR